MHSQPKCALTLLLRGRAGVAKLELVRSRVGGQVASEIMGRITLGGGSIIAVVRGRSDRWWVSTIGPKAELMLVNNTRWRLQCWG